MHDAVRAGARELSPWKLRGRVLADSFQGAGLVVEPDVQPNVPPEMDVIKEEDVIEERALQSTRFVAREADVRACVERQRVIFML